MNWTTQFVIATSSSLTTAILLWIVRQVIRLRKSAEKLMNEHRYLMRAMQLVLTHLGLQSLLDENARR